jgi:hypothetical protein
LSIATGRPEQSTLAFAAHPNAEDFMANQDDHTNEVDPNADSKEMRLMWIGSGVIVLLILALMGYNMMYNGNMPPDATEMSSQSRTAPAPAH